MTTLLLCIILSCFHGVVTGQLSQPPEWFSLIENTFSSTKFPLRRCPKRGNIAPASGMFCGPKQKTCFFGNQMCNGEADSNFSYPDERCMCDGKNFMFGNWTCQAVVCPGAEPIVPPEDPPTTPALPVTTVPAGSTTTTAAATTVAATTAVATPGTDCVDAILADTPWMDNDGDTCSAYETNGYCQIFGNGFGAGNLTANQVCCACGGGAADPVTETCSDTGVSVDPPVTWTDSVGEGCSWYAASAQTRCIDFANERNAELGLTVSEACCACADVLVPSTSSTCTDLAGWTTAAGVSCSGVTRMDCRINTENFGFAATDACCKCGSRATDPNAPTVFEPPPLEPFTAGLCTSDSERFNMCIKISNNVAAQDVALFDGAASKWSSVIVGDSPDFAYNSTDDLLFSPPGIPRSADLLPGFYERLCGYDPEFPGAGSTDDLDVCVSQRILLPGVLAQTMSVFGDMFTRFGIMNINADSVGPLRNSSQLSEVILHELGHILGIGNLWESAAPGQVNVNREDCMYVGENANRVYSEISGCTNVNIPIEEPRELEFSFGGDTIIRMDCGGNLQETCFRDELMTSVASSSGSSPLSALTVALLEDLGYTVDYDQADPFNSSDMDSSCVCNQRLQGGLDGAASPKPQLSAKGQAKLMTYAKQEWKRTNDAAKDYIANDMEGMEGDERPSVNISGMTIMYMEDGIIHAVDLTSLDLEEVP